MAKQIDASLRRAYATVAVALLAVCGPDAHGDTPRPRPGALETPLPRYEVEVTRDIWVPMRDGVRLATDLYWPRGVSGKLPVVLIRTPYGKDADGIAPLIDAARFFASHGFAVVTQDFRGRYRSEGVFHFTRGVGDDGYDTMKWILAQPWSSGRIGTYGCSFLGEAQLYQAETLPPGLTAMIPQASGSAVGSAGGYFENAADLGGGVWQLSVLFDWFYRTGTQLFYAPRQESLFPENGRAAIADLYPVAPQMPSIDYDPILRTLPLIDQMSKVVTPPNEYNELLRHDNDFSDPWWKRFPYIREGARIDAPSLFIETWNDFTAGAALYIRKMFERTAGTEVARQNQFIIVGPGEHCTSERTTADYWVGDQFAGDPRFGHKDIYLKWFRYWLLGDQNGITTMPKVQYYVLGRNLWRAANDWPVPGTHVHHYYLHSGGEANSHFGDGVLSETPAGSERPDGYAYDPMNPVPSLGVNDYTGSRPIADQRPLSARRDVLVYTSAPLTAGFEMTGDIVAVIYVRSSARDTDFMVKLVDVYPGGNALNVREEAFRARYRNGRDRPAQFMSPGEVYRLDIKLGAYSLYFPAGHRLRVQVTSSSFPRYERNLNTGGSNFDESQGVIAHNSVYHDARHPSHIDIPVVPE